jgi:hypothetical protein
LRTDAVVGADERTKRGRRAAELERDPDFFFHGQAESAVLLRNRQSEEAERFHFRDQRLGNRIALRDLGLVRNEALAYEAGDVVEQRGKRVGISDHVNGRDAAKATLLEASSSRRCVFSIHNTAPLQFA